MQGLAGWGQSQAQVEESRLRSGVQSLLGEGCFLGLHFEKLRSKWGEEEWRGLDFGLLLTGVERTQGDPRGLAQVVGVALG